MVIFSELKGLDDISTVPFLHRSVYNIFDQFVNKDRFTFISQQTFPKVKSYSMIPSLEMKLKLSAASYSWYFKFGTDSKYAIKQL